MKTESCDGAIFVVMTTCSASDDDSVGIMTTFGFHCW